MCSVNRKMERYGMFDKFKKLSENIGLFTICNFGQKILSFLLLPLYTSYLTTEQYGTSDLIGTIASLLVPVFTISIADGVLRFTMDEPGNSSYMRYGLRVHIEGATVLILAEIVTFFCFHNLIPGRYYIWIFMIYISQALNTLYLNYLRGVDNVPTMVVANLLTTSITLLLNVALIVFFHLGLNGLLLATVIGNLSCVLFVEKKEYILKRVLSSPPLPEKKRYDVVRYSIPQIFSSLAWWINSSLDRIFVTAICGLSGNGIYSMAYKIPNISSIFERIFSQAWLLSSVKEFDEDDTDSYFSTAFSIYNLLLLVISSTIILMNIPISRFLYVGDFFEAWKCVPYLIAASYFNALNAFIGNIYMAAKRPKEASISAVISAVMNFTFNILLIPKMGIVGAAIATMVSYIVVYLIRLFSVKKVIRWRIPQNKILLSQLLLIIQVILAYTEYHFYILQVACVLIIIMLHYRFGKKLVLKMVKLLRQRL